jgi:hypothetical protein
MRLSDDYVEVDTGSQDLDPPALALDGVSGGNQTGGKQSRLISRVLSPALRLWVRSQLDHVEDLHLEIEANDRQLLSGAIQQVSASARKGIYQGLHLSQINLVGQQIQTNLRQVLRGKPFRLLTAFPIAGTVVLSEADLNASLNAPLLANAITDFLLSLLLRDSGEGNLTHKAANFHDVQVRFGEGDLTFTAILALTEQQTYPLTICTGLRIQDGNRLILERFQCQISGSQSAILSTDLPDRWVFEMGSEVCLEELQIQPEQISCCGRIMVQP